MYAMPAATCAAMSTRLGSFSVRPSPFFRKSSKLPVKGPGTKCYDLLYTFCRCKIRHIRIFRKM
uniref:Uncharacterized protein n=1 Tax=Anguilla anguilla TaxID=7936 RepID=A0A0E9W9Z1_ANGAN